MSLLNYLKTALLDDDGEILLGSDARDPPPDEMLCECRICGSTVHREKTRCPVCNSTEIAEYQF